MTSIPTIARRRRKWADPVSAVSAPVLATVVLLALWELAGALASSSLLPMPSSVLSSLKAVLATPGSYYDIGITFERVLVSTVIAFAVGTVVGVAMGLSKRAELYFRPMVVVGLGVPGPVYIVITIVVLGFSQAATTLALVASVTPFVANIVLGGVADRDRGLDEMATVFRLTRSEYVREVIVGQVLPVVLLGLRTSFALSWKLVVLMEALSTSRGIGAQMVFYFRLLDTARVAAYLIIFMVIMSIVESQIFRRVQDHGERWKMPNPNAA